MIHPDTELRFVNKRIGYGVFATASIPTGTIVYVKDPLEIELTQKQFAALVEPYRSIAEKYSYIDQCGVRIISWDHAKYVNHRCDCNTISAGYGFEIAIRDIRPGEEITDEYGLFNIEREIALACRCSGCRHVLRPSDVDMYHEIWDAWVIEALNYAARVAQPLWDFMDPLTRQDLIGYLNGHKAYRSVRALKWERRAGTRSVRRANGRGKRRAA